jgi:sialate O-acetylesterase
MNYILSVFLFFLISLQSYSQGLSLPSLFSDNMVMQQQTKITIWGWADKSDEISISASWGQQSTTGVNSSGKWKTTLETPAAGGPYELIVKGKISEIKIKNILIGEVWICSGQSNMEMTFAGWPPRDTVYKASEEIRKAGNPNIRMFNVARVYSLKPQEKCKGTWQETTSESIKGFSATAYYFGNELYSKLKVPIGLINSSWGGTQMKSWTSEDALSMYPEFSALRENFNQLKGVEASKNKWLEKHKKIELPANGGNEVWVNLDFFDSICSTTNFSDLDWERMKLPIQWEKTSLGDFDGAVWFRKTIDLPAKMVGKELLLELPPVDDMDQAWVNGVQVGAIEIPGFWQTIREYTVPETLTNTGKLVIAIRIIDHQGGGGIWETQKPFQVSLKSDTSNKVNLAGFWKYLVVAEYKENVFYLFDIENREYQSRASSNKIGPNTPTVLYNAMINPLAPYSIKGFVWYQGESNVGGADNYASYLSTMVKDWRKCWDGEKLPFYFVQIAPYKYSGKMNTESGELRNAQRAALKSIDKTGIVVTLDIGDVNCIHPPKKKEVGERLAKWALANEYHQDIVCSGPLYKSYSIEDNKIRIKFDYAENGLTASADSLTGFEIAGKDMIFVEAKAIIENNTVVVYSDKIERPVSVRYAWRNCSEASLMNKDGLPASTFITK